MKRTRSLLSLFLAAFMLFSMTITAFAASVTVDDLYWAFDGELPEWSEIADAAMQDPDEVDVGDDAAGEIEYKKYLKKVEIYKAFGSAGAYSKVRGNLEKYASWNEDTEEVEATIKTATGEKNFTRAVNSFNGVIGSATTEQTIGGLFDTDNWNPNAGFATPFLDWFYGLVNTIFYVVSNIVIWWFLVQTSFDMLYMVAEPLRPFISSANGSSSSGGGYGGGYGNNNAGGALSKIKIPICSEDVIRACGGAGGSGGGYGGGGYGGGSNAKTTNPAIAYIISRAPIICVIGVYLVLVTTGWWPKIIAWLAGIATRGISLIVK